MLNTTRDALALTGGAEAPRDLPIPGRDLDGIHFAMDFLPQQNKPRLRRQARRAPDSRRRQACGRDRRRRHRLGLHRHLVPPGRAVGDAARDHAAPPEHENKAPDLAELAAEAAHLVEPGRRRAREFAVLTQKFSGENGKVTGKLHCVQVDDKFKPIAGSEFDLDGRTGAAGDGLRASGA
jgi:glutamate synthase (NADPH/NADH) small chain